MVMLAQCHSLQRHLSQKKKAYSDIFLLAHEYTDKSNVSVGSVNGFIYSVVDLVWEIFFYYYRVSHCSVMIVEGTECSIIRFGNVAVSLCTHGD
jgi:hypothetical protein